MKRLFYCKANGPFGPYGDYVWAKNRNAAACIFRERHGDMPTAVEGRRLNP